MSMQTFDRSRLGFIAEMYFGGGSDGDGRDMTGSAPRRNGSRDPLAAPHVTGFNARPHAGNFEDAAGNAVDPENPETLLIALEEELAARARTRPNGARKPVVHVNGVRLEDWLEGRTGPVVAQSLFLCGPRIVPQQEQRGRRRRRRRGGRGRRANAVAA